MLGLSPLSSLPVSGGSLISGILEGVYGTGEAGSMLFDSPTPNGVFGTGILGSLAPVVQPQPLGIFGTGAVQSLDEQFDVGANPLGVHGTGVVQMLFPKVRSSQIAREVLTKNSTTQINASNVSREVVIENITSIIRSSGLVREVVTENSTSIVRADQIAREVLYHPASSPSSASVRSSQLVREAVYSNVQPLHPASIWARRNGGNWNNDPSADPATGVGGLSISAIAGQVLYVIGTGSDSNQIFNFGATSFSYTVPSGFTAGWPAHAGGFTSFDPSTAIGDVTLSNGNLQLQCNPSQGVVQTLDGWNSGSYYFEYENVFNTFFTGGVGAGVGINDSLTTPDNYNGIAGGGLDTSFHANLTTQQGGLISNIFVQGNGDVMSFAIAMGQAFESFQTVHASGIVREVLFNTNPVPNKAIVLVVT